MDRSTGWDGELDFRVLGTIEARVNGVSVDVGGPTQRRLLAALLVDVNRVVTTDALIDRVWDDGDRPAAPEKAIRTYVSRLRKSMNDAGSPGDAVLVTDAPGYRLSLRNGQLDSGRFAKLVANGIAEVETRPSHAVEALDAAQAMWRGQPYLEFNDRPWAEAEAARLVELHAAALEERAAARMALGAHAEVVADLESLVHADPLRGRPVELLMTALFRSDRQAEALRVADRYRRALAEVGFEPSRAFIELESGIVAGDRSLLAVDTATESLRGYELAEQIGEGAFSIVYRGVQPSLGREVAIKQIRSELANRPEFIRRFEAEAHMVATLEHPHIVPLYDYWREPGAAFLVMRWLRGGTLESHLRERQLDLREAVEMTEQVGSALASAHGAGVVHRDVKSPNIFVDDTGNYYLGDFGIAVDTETRHDPEALLSAGSPAYASPEQLRREPVGPASDVHSLGIVLYEALTGRLPFPDAPSQAALLQRQLNDPIPPVRDLRQDIPAEVDAVIGRATAKQPEARYPTVAEFIDALESAVTGDDAPALRTMARGARTVIGHSANPYKGLRAFQESDADDFFGRDRLVDRLVAQLKDPGTAGRLVAAVGPSGSGKSSVVRAGLLPRLRRGALAGSADWFISSMIPGADPFEELEAALSRIASAPTAGLVETMRSDGRGIARAVKTVLPDETSELLLVVDQFEELFTLVTDDRMRNAFIEGLADAVSDPRSRLRVVVTIRADFWDRPLRHAELARILETSAVTVTPLAADELERAIVDPALRVGVELEPGLAPVIAADVQDQPGGLPLLQYALTELFDRQVSGLMRLDDYRDLGGVTGALARRAEELYTASTQSEQDAVRSLFGRLVTPGEGTEDTRRRALRSELATSSEAETVIQRYGEARLLSFDHDPASREPTVELAHEALVREWPRLREWLDEDRATLRIHRQVTVAAAGWHAADLDTSELYRGGRLESAEPLLESDTLNADETSFLRASVTQRTAEADTDRRRVRRLRRSAVITALVAVIALIAGSLALVQWNRANDEADEAENLAVLAAANEQVALDNAEEAAEQAAAADAAAVLAEQRAAEAEQARAEADFDRLVALARTADPNDPTTALLLAVEAHRAKPSFDSLDALHLALTARPGFLGSLPSPLTGNDITVLDDGERFVVHTDGTIELWNVRTRSREHRWPFPGANEQNAFERFELRSTAATDGSVVVGVSSSVTSVIEVITGNELMRLDHAGAQAVALSPDNETLAIGFDDGRVEVRRIGREAALIAQSTWDSNVSELRWHPDGDHLLVGTYRSFVSAWSPETGETLWTTEGVEAPAIGDNAAWGPLYSSDGARIVISTQAGVSGGGNARADSRRVVRVLDSATGLDQIDPIADAAGHEGFAWAEPTETEVIATSFTTPIGRFDVRAGQELPFEVVKPGVGAMAGVFADLGVLIVPGAGQLDMLDLDRSGPLARRVVLPAGELGARNFRIGAFTDDGESFITSLLFTPGVIRVADLTTDSIRPPTRFEAPDDAGTVQLTERFGSAWFNQTSEGFVVRQGGPTGPVMGPTIASPGSVRAVYLSPTGNRLALTVGTDILLYDVTSGDLIATLDDVPQPANDNAFTVPWFSPDGSALHAWNGFGSARFDAETGELVWTSNDFGYAYPGPADQWFATLGDGGEVVLRDPVTLEPTGAPLIGHAGDVTHFYVDHKGERVVTLSRDLTARVWNLAERQQLGRELSLDGLSVGKAYWSPDDAIVAIPVTDGFVLWNYDSDTWSDIACEVAGRNLTKEEWDQFGPRTIDRRPTCPEHPLN